MRELTLQLPLSEQFAMSLRRPGLLLNLLNPPAPASPLPSRGSPTPPAGGFNLSVEPPMIERQQKTKEPLTCKVGHQPHMYSATGNGAVTYFVECSPCEVRTKSHSTAEAAAGAWARGELAAHRAAAADAA